MRQFSTLFRRNLAASAGAILLVVLPPAAPRGAAGDIKGMSDEAHRDRQLENLARRTLFKESELSGCNIAATVSNQVATIWGSVPSSALSKRAELTVRNVPGITRVINNCRIVAAADPIPQAIADAVHRSLELGSDPSAISARLTPSLPSPSTMASRQVVAKPAPDESTAAPSTPAAVLLPPVTADDPSRAEAIRLSEKRFKDLVLDIKGGVVTINGGVARLKDAWELAEKLNDMPGIKQVMIGKVTEK